jgi:hypothetical protein
VSRLSSTRDLAVDVFYTPLSVQRPGQAAGNEGLFNVRALVVYRLRR